MKGEVLIFTIQGIINNELEQITFSNENGYGEIKGDQRIVLLVMDALESSSLTGPVGQYIDRDINNQLSVLFVIKECFDYIINYTGEIPCAKDIPEGAY